MPESLNTRKKLLKTLQLTDYATLIEDLNFNFATLLSSPLFVGTQGEAGTPGSQGSPGIRGSKWMFAQLDKFREQWPDDGLLGEYQINLDYLNKKLLSEEDRNKLLEATGAGDMFVDGDTFVSNARIYMLDLSNNKFIDTNTSVNSNSDIYQENLYKYIQQVVNELLTNNPVYMGLVQTIDYQMAQGKNYTDSSANINNQLNEFTMLDVDSTSAKDGIEIENMKMFLPSGNVFDDADNLEFIIGGAEAYHQLIQATLRFNENDPNNTVAKFGPTYGNPPSLVLLQNTQDSGVMIGYKKATNFTQFARFWVNANGGFVISSPNVSDHYLKYSDIQLYQDHIDINSDLININGKLTFKDVIEVKELTSKTLKVTDDSVTVGDELKEVHVLGNKVYFDNFLESDFMCINSEKKLTKSPYTVSSATTLSGIGEGSRLELVSTLLLKNIATQISEQSNTISTLRNEVQNVSSESKKSSSYLEKRIVSSGVKNSFVPGQIVELIIDGEDQTWDILKTRLFESSGQGRSEVSYKTCGVFQENVDLSLFKLCDGNNGTPPLTSYAQDSKETYFMIKIVFKG